MPGRPRTCADDDVEGRVVAGAGDGRPVQAALGDGVRGARLAVDDVSASRLGVEHRQARAGLVLLEAPLGAPGREGQPHHPNHVEHAHVKDLEGAVLGPRHETVAVRRHRHAQHGARVRLGAQGTCGGCFAQRGSAYVGEEHGPCPHLVVLGKFNAFALLLPELDMTINGSSDHKTRWS